MAHSTPLRWSRAVVLLALLGVLAGCRPVASRRPRNVLLISIDSLRADRLGCQGNPRRSSPALDRLAAAGARFARAYAPSSWTLPSHATLLSGTTQARHGAVAPDRPMRDDVTTLATRLAAQGYHTRGVFSGPFLEARYGFDRGFGEYVSCEGFAETSPNRLDRSHSTRTSECVRNRVTKWSRTDGKAPFFWFVHLWDVHYDYVPPARYVRRFDPDYAGRLDGRRIAGTGFLGNASQRDVAHLLACYDGEVRWVDDTIARLLHHMQRTGRLDDTLVVVTADHGDEFHEHGFKMHRRTVYGEVVHVPLILVGPGVPRGRVVETPVGLVDVAPTVLDLLGLPATGMDGRSLRPLMDGTTRAHPPVVSVLYQSREKTPPLPLTIAVRRDAITLMRPLHETTWVAFDPIHDPAEQTPVPVLDRTLLRQAQAAAARARVRPAVGAAAHTVDLPPAKRRQLRVLGYIE
jgi:arylsulfatase A-like enzyme